MGEWKTKPLNELGDFISGVGFPLVYQGYRDGQYPFFKVSDLNNVGNEISLSNANNTISEHVRYKLGIKIIPQHSIVFAKIGAAIYLERKRKMEKDGIIDNNMAAFISNGEISFDLMYYLFQKVAIGSFTNTTALPAVDMRGLGKHQLFFPIDPAEQRRIAAVLIAADEAITASCALVKKYASIKQGLMRDLLTGEKVPLDAVVKINPYRGSKLPDKFYYIDLESVVAGSIVKENIVTHKEAPSRAQRLLLPNDILFQTVRPYQQNNYLFLQERELRTVASTGYAQMRTENNPIYIYYLLHQDSFVHEVNNRSTGSNYPAINPTELAKCSVYFEYDINRQNEIADILTAADERLTAERERLRKLEDIKRGLMDDLLTNRVSTDKLQGGV